MKGVPIRRKQGIHDCTVICADSSHVMFFWYTNIVAAQVDRISVAGMKQRVLYRGKKNLDRFLSVDVADSEAVSGEVP